MARHPFVWMGRAGTNELLLLIAGMATLALGAGFVVRRSLDEAAPPARGAWWRAGGFSLVCIVILALFPQAIIGNVPGELFALGAGIVLLFLPLSALVIALVPMRDAGDGPPSAGAWFAWAGVVFIGTAIGTCLFLLEAREGIAPGRYLLVAAVFIGAGTLGLTTAYAFLRKPLGLYF